MTTRNYLFRIPLLGAIAAIAIVSVPACAAAAPGFNPDRLHDPQVSRVEAVCESVMGLSPSERLVGGYWMGDSRLDYWTSRYRGCVTSLSDSMSTITANQANEQADRDCRAKGYTTGSSDLALCVLQTARATESAETAQPTSQPLPSASGSLFYASASERRRREELACAAIGIEPTGDAFKACVSDLQRTFHAIDTPIS
jgi:hypothetical protein